MPTADHTCRPLMWSIDRGIQIQGAFQISHILLRSKRQAPARINSPARQHDAPRTKWHARRDWPVQPLGRSVTVSLVLMMPCRSPVTQAPNRRYLQRGLSTGRCMHFCASEATRTARGWTIRGRPLPPLSRPAVRARAQEHTRTQTVIPLAESSMLPRALAYRRSQNVVSARAGQHTSSSSFRARETASANGNGREWSYSMPTTILMRPAAISYHP